MAGAFQVRGRSDNGQICTSFNLFHGKLFPNKDNVKPM